MASSTYRPEWSNDDLQQNVSEAQWVDYNLDGLATITVGSLVPTAFDAFARVLYPVRASTTQHASSKTVAPWRDQLESVSTVLTRHTTTPDECWFAVWEGNTALDDIRATAPTAAIAGYNYFLLKGPVSRATDTLERLSPNLWWPSDHTWCVAQHFDFPCAYLGGSTETVSDILALAEVESRPVRVNQNITAGYDESH
ncbi:hypothetical protein O4160_17525 [Rhodococcus sp. IEGM 1401]|uniref:Uncharacterized protein n=1 Tax=Rhodococcus cerastii TaxID=908616 RepID=A0ABU4D0R7_9NOCA|nr:MULTISPECIES: hypothetical protein [Rhodococcus]MCZ4562646.1 hypothetical protein [Rhodococcus sp. IEGM 1401]MDI9922841.1 hypothetical protein [Rhodococcus sp. IEGM 1372]MDV6302899.1 hypothetical protein [Rhodococcus cerastii]MDV8035389.1 hypothetical protein [Rhodococcus sp. IEGM 1414]MDV8079071.1 hypothetical protein [Rhodococcus sp. IEGM 1370]